MAAAALGLSVAWLAPVGTASAQDGVTVGGWVEVIGGTSDHDGGVDGISRGLFSRFSVGYDTVLDNGLAIAGRTAFQFNQRGSGAVINPSGGRATTATRMDAATNYAPDVLYISVGGGFGTISVGAHAPANCSLMPRPIAFVNGVNSTHYTLFSGVSTTNGTFSENNYCGTPESVSYATPDIGGFKAMITYAPDNASNQGTSLANAQNLSDLGNIEDRVDMAASWSGAMGGANASVGVGYQSGADDALDSLTVAGTVGFGGFTFGASWFDNDDGARVYAGATEDELERAAREATPDINPDRGVVEREHTFGTSVMGAIEAGAHNGTRTDALPGDVAWQQEQDGWTVAGKYDIGALTLGVTYSDMSRDNHTIGASRSTTVEKNAAGDPLTDAAHVITQTDIGLASDVEESALVLGASYAVGGGLTTWIEYMDLEQSYTNTKTVRVITDGTVAAPTTTTTRTTNDDSLFLVGITLGF